MTLARPGAGFTSEKSERGYWHTGCWILAGKKKTRRAARMLCLLRPVASLPVASLPRSYGTATAFSTLCPISVGVRADSFARGFRRWPTTEDSTACTSSGRTPACPWIKAHA